MRRVLFAALVAGVCGGCMRVLEITRTPDGFEVDYLALGLKTDVSRIEAARETNGTVRVVINGVATDVSARNAGIITAAGAAAGEAVKAAAALK